MDQLQSGSICAAFELPGLPTISPKSGEKSPVTPVLPGYGWNLLLLVPLFGLGTRSLPKISASLFGPWPKISAKTKNFWR